MEAMNPPKNHAKLRVHKTDPAELPPPDFSLEEESLRQEEAAIEKRKLDLEQKRNEAEANARREKKAAYDALLDDAKDWREMAREFDDPEKAKSYFAKAKAAEAEAIELGHELGLMTLAPSAAPATAPEKLPWLAKHHRTVAAIQVSAVLGLIGLMLLGFNLVKAHIDELNTQLPFDKQLLPYDITSLQKFFFEKLVVFADLPVALGILFLLMPWIGFYVLPFLKSRKDFYREFYEELSPFQRQCITTSLVIGILLFLALSHSVKP